MQSANGAGAPPHAYAIAFLSAVGLTVIAIGVLNHFANK